MCARARALMCVQASRSGCHATSIHALLRSSCPNHMSLTNGDAVLRNVKAIPMNRMYSLTVGFYSPRQSVRVGWCGQLCFAVSSLRAYVHAQPSQGTCALLIHCREKTLLHGLINLFPIGSSPHLFLSLLTSGVACQGPSMYSDQAQTLRIVILSCGGRGSTPKQ